MAAAGPAVNLLMAIGWALLARIALGLAADNCVALPLLLMGVAGMLINTILTVLNLLPLPPLDGGRVLTGLLPTRYAIPFARIEPYGFWVLIILLVTGLLGWVMWPMMRLVLDFLVPVTGMPDRYFYQIAGLILPAT